MRDLQIRFQSLVAFVNDTGAVLYYSQMCFDLKRVSYCDSCAFIANGSELFVLLITQPLNNYYENY